MDRFSCTSCSVQVDYVNYVEPTGSEMKSRQICFHCHYWMELAEREANEKDSPGFIVLGDSPCFKAGEHLRYAPDVPRGSFAGFGGSHYEITFSDGRVVNTKNLWYQGMVPDRFVHLFKVYASVSEGGKKGYTDSLLNQGRFV